MKSATRILISGGCGFIGSHLVRLALARGYRVLNLDALTYAGNLSSLEDVQDHERYRFAQIDLREPDLVDQALRDFSPEAVIHLAAESHSDRSIDQPRIFVETNITGTFHLLQASLRHHRALKSEKAGRFRFLHVSTDEVFGSLREQGTFDEQSRYDPHSPYSASKAASDHLARAWHYTYGLPVSVSNCSNNYGPYQYPEKLIPVVILKCLRGEPIPIYGTGENIRDWIYVEDHCDALLRIMERGRPGQSYAVGAREQHSNLEIARTVCEILDQLAPSPGCRHEDRIELVADRPGHDFRYAIDPTKIETELSWKARSEFSSSLRATVTWYLENQSWWQPILAEAGELKRRGIGQHRDQTQ